MLHALAADHEVHLLVVGRVHAGALAAADLPVARRMAVRAGVVGAATSVLRRAARLCAPALGSRATRPPEWAALGGSVRAAIRRFVADRNIAVQHVFRLYMMPVAEVVQAQLPHVKTQLDLDDLEVDTRLRFAELHEQRGERRDANLARHDARFYQGAASRYLPAVSHVWVCSDRDAARLREQAAAIRVAVVPNTIGAPSAPLRPRNEDPFTFLFVGALGYFPNRAGVGWFLDEVMPLLRGAAPRPFRVRIVGRESRTRRLRAIRSSTDVEFAGFADDVTPHYAAAGAVVVPIHAGGGTRIKVIEAFAHGCPVVTTAMGVEGLDVEDGVHVLLADSARLFAEQCARLMTTPAIAAGLVSRARELFDRRYSPSVVADAVHRASSTCR